MMTRTYCRKAHSGARNVVSPILVGCKIRLLQLNNQKTYNETFSFAIVSLEQIQKFAAGIFMVKAVIRKLFCGKKERRDNLYEGHLDRG